jgi:hypothetical protein
MRQSVLSSCRRATRSPSATLSPASLVSATTWGFAGRPTGRSFAVRARAVASHTMVVTNLATVGAGGVATRSARATVVIINPVPTFTG